MFDEARFEIYMHHELVDLKVPKRTKAEKSTASYKWIDGKNS